MKNEQKKYNRFSGLTDRAVSDDELTEVTGGQFDPDGGQGGYMSGYNFGPCSERGYYTVSNACLCPLCSKLRDDGTVCSCQDGPQRGLTPSPSCF